MPSPEGPQSATRTGAICEQLCSLRSQVQFGMSLFSPFASGGILAYGKDLYILKLGANTSYMAAFGIFVGIWGPLCPIISGWLMEQDLLNKCFPWSTWGRRAPWFMTHLILLGFCGAAVLIPPTADETLVCFWYLICAACGTWAAGMVFASFESVRVELYPTKEERSFVEAITKISLSVGLGGSFAVLLILAVSASHERRMAAAAATLILGLVSLVAVPVQRMARQPFDRACKGSTVSEYAGLLAIPTFRRFLIFRIVWAVMDSIKWGTVPYYLKFVEGQSDADMAVTVATIGSANTVGGGALLLGWTWFFCRKRNVNINHVCAFAILCGLWAPAAMLFLSWMDAPWAFCFYFLILQFSMIGQSFWRVSALGWIVDEDCHAVEGRRREALFVGVQSFVNALGGALGTGLVLVGLDAFGLAVTNCEEACLSEQAEARETCLLDCEVQNSLSQPVSVVNFLRSLYLIVITFCQIAAAYLTFSFPICGARLEAIYTKQAGPQKQIAKE